MHYGQLVDDIEEITDSKRLYIGLFGDFLRKLVPDLVKNNFSRCRYIPLEMFLDFSSLCRILFNCGERKKIKSMIRRMGDEKFEFEGVNISPLICAELLDNLGKPTVLKVALTKKAFEGFLKKHSEKVVSLIYYWEFHIWEQAFSVPADKYSSFKTIGFQHAIVPFICINHYPSPGEMVNGDLPDDLKIKFPDLIMFTGEEYRQRLIKCGFDEKRTVLCGAYRFPEMAESLQKVSEKRIEKKENDSLEILVCCTVEQDETLSILERLSGALDKIEYQVKVKIKFHPYRNLSGSDEFKKLAEQGAEETILPVQELLGKADVLITGSSTVGIEAFAVNCPVVWISSGYQVLGAPWYEVKNSVVFSPETSEDLIKNLNNVRDTKPEVAEMPKAAKTYASGLMGRIDKNAVAKIFQ